MLESQHSSNAISILNEVITKSRTDRVRMAKMLGDFKKVHIHVRKELDKAVSEVNRLNGILQKSERENARLAKRERELAQEVSMMAAAIEVANREIAESDSLLLDTANSVNADFRIGQKSPQQPVPDVRIAPALPQDTASAANPAATKAASPVAQAKPVSASSPAPVEHATALPRQAMAKTPASPMDGADELDESFADIEKMLVESINGISLK